MGRFWVIEFPTLTGAEAWIDAEMAPPYGRYGYYEYYTARHWGRGHFSQWVAGSPEPVVPDVRDPHHVPTLAVDRGSVVALLFGRWRPEASEATSEMRGDIEHIERMQSVARKHELMRLEAFKLMGAQDAWHRAWGEMNFPTLEGAEAWIDTEVLPPHGRYSQKAFIWHADGHPNISPVGYNTPMLNIRKWDNETRRWVSEKRGERRK